MLWKSITKVICALCVSLALLILLALIRFNTSPKQISLEREIATNNPHSTPSPVSHSGPIISYDERTRNKEFQVNPKEFSNFDFKNLSYGRYPLELGGYVNVTLHDGEYEYYSQ